MAGPNIDKAYPGESSKLGLVSSAQLLLDRRQCGFFFGELGVEVW
jgi:hypothetical protein